MHGIFNSFIFCTTLPLATKKKQSWLTWPSSLPNNFSPPSPFTFCVIQGRHCPHPLSALGGPPIFFYSSSSFPSLLHVSYLYYCSIITILMYCSGRWVHWVCGNCTDRIILVFFSNCFSIDFFFLGFVRTFCFLFVKQALPFLKAKKVMVMGIQFLDLILCFFLVHGIWLVSATGFLSFDHFLQC